MTTTPCSSLPRPAHLVLLAGALLAFAAVPAGAQIPDQFTNLKVLPKDIAKRELVGMMRGFATGLGVRCNHCHVGEDPSSLEGYDFASDDKEAKRTARVMMKMVREINGTFLPQTGLENPAQVECVTCHRGILEPQSLARLLLAVAESDGAEAAAARYRELRAEHYGSGAYDFSPRTLHEVSETLAQTDLDAALTLARLSLEFDPDVAYSHLVVGQVLLFKGEVEAGLASLEKAIALEPDNALYKRQLALAKEKFGSDKK